MRPPERLTPPQRRGPPSLNLQVLGCGVAGLAAVQTAKNLGAVVSAYDVRPVVREQVESLGGKFLKVDYEEDGAGAGGYAKEMSEGCALSSRAPNPRRLRRWTTRALLAHARRAKDRRLPRPCRDHHTLPSRSPQDAATFSKIAV